MQYLAVVLLLICGIQIVLNTGQKRLSWFMCSLLLFYSSIVVIQKPHVTAHRFLIITYWISILYYNEEKALRSFPLKSVLILYAATLVISCLPSQQLSLFYKLYKPMMFMLDNYLLLMVGFTVDSRQFVISKPVRIVIYAITVYGLICYITQTDILRQILQPDFLEHYYFGERKRVASTWSHPIAYGYICSLLTLLVLYDYKKRDRVAVLLLLFANVFICGSRTAIVCYFIMLITYWLFAYDLNRKFQVLLTAILFAVLSLESNVVRDDINEVYLSVSGKESLRGSSVEMRTTQLGATMVVAAGSPIVGHGLDYIHEVMGFGTDKWVDVSYEFAGFESYFYTIIIERGWLGVAAEILVLFSILYICFTHRKSREASAFIIATLLGFVVFATMTGKLDTPTLSFLLMGVMLKRLYVDKGRRTTRIIRLICKKNM